MTTEDIDDLDLPFEPSPPGRAIPVRSSLGLLAAGAAALAVALTAGHPVTGTHPVTGRHPVNRTPPRTPSAAGALPTSVADGLSGVTSLVDADGYLWAVGTSPSGAAAVAHVELASGRTGSLTAPVPAGGTADAGSLASDGTHVDVVHPGEGTVSSFAADGSPLASDIGLGAHSIVASRAGLFALACCDGDAASGDIRLYDPASLLPGDLDVSVTVRGNTAPPFAGGPAGIWLVDGDAKRFARIDEEASTPEVAPIGVPLGDLADGLLAVGDDGPVLATSDQLVSADRSGATTAATLGEGEQHPRALAVSGTTVYLAFADHIARYTLAPGSLDETSGVPVAGVTALSAGPDGVWAATGGRVVQLAR